MTHILLSLHPFLTASIIPGQFRWPAAHCVMGAGQSLSSQHQPPSKALHVLRVTPSSPASKTTIEPFFDFVVGFEGDAAINKVDAAELEKIVESHEGRTLNLVVWSSKVQESRGTQFLTLLAQIQMIFHHSGANRTFTSLDSNHCHTSG